MGANTAYAISAALVLAMEYIVYKCLLANTTFYRFNRVVLLLCYVAALVAVPIGSVLRPARVAGGAVLGVGEPMVTAMSGGVEASWSLYDVVPIIYVGGVGLMAIFTLISYARMAVIIRRSRHQKLGDAVLVVADRDVAPFSWGKFIVVGREDAENGLIIEHELRHVRLHHSVDLIFAQLFIVFNWFNPVAYLMRRELSAVHEFDVDKQVLETGVNATEYQMLLIKKTVGPGFQSIANSLNHSQLKNRLTMMLRTKTNAARRLCAAALVPAVVLAVAMTDFPAVASTIGNIASVSYGKGSESSSKDKIASSYLIKSVSSEGDKTTFVIECEGVESPMNVSGAMVTAMGEVYHARSMECAMKDGNAVITATFPLIERLDGMNLSLNVNGMEVVLFNGAQSPDGEETVDVAEVMPEYPGGFGMWMKAILDELKWPDTEGPKGDFDGSTVVGFTVMKDGSVADIKLVKSCGSEEFDAHAMEAVAKAFAGKKWTPGMNDGKPVNCRFAVPIKFKANK